MQLKFSFVWLFMINKTHQYLKKGAMPTDRVEMLELISVPAMGLQEIIKLW